MCDKLMIALVWLVIFIAYGAAGELEYQDAQRGYIGTSVVFVEGR